MSDLFSNNITKDSFLSLQNKAKDLVAQIDWVITQRKEDYIEDLLQLRAHSSVQIKRKVASGIGSITKKEHLETIKEWQSNESDRKTWLLLESLIDTISRKGDYEVEHNEQVLTVSEVIVILKNLIGKKEYIIEGELTEIKPIRSMYYFGLKDNQDSRINCWMFEGVQRQNSFPLNDGLAVRIHGTFKLSKDGSRMIFSVTKIRLTGEGEMLRNLKLLEAKLSKEGLFDQNRKRAIAILPRTIALVASPNSAAMEDFTKVLTQRIGGIRIIHVPIKTQGVGAEFEILSQLENLNSRIAQLSVETVIITRGGGSNDDLAVFNSERVVRAIHSISVPTIVAIGHERDITLAEMVADQRASTPSNAAELTSYTKAEVLSHCNQHLLSIQHIVNHKVQQYKYTQRQLMIIIMRYFQNQIQYAQTTIRSLDVVAIKIITQVRSESSTALHYIINSFKPRIESAQRETVYSLLQINNNVIRTHETLKNSFHITYQRITIQDPRNVLKLGYAIVRRGETIIESKSMYQRALTGRVQLEFSDGIVDIET